MKEHTLDMLLLINNRRMIDAFQRGDTTLGITYFWIIVGLKIVAGDIKVTLKDPALGLKRI